MAGSTLSFAERSVVKSRNTNIIVPRRTIPTSTKNLLERVQGGQGERNYLGTLYRGAANAPLLILDLLLQTMPLARRARHINNSVAFGKGKTKFVAYSDVASKTVDGDATASLDDLWRAIHPSIAGPSTVASDTDSRVAALQRLVAYQFDSRGMACLESVLKPGGMSGTMLLQDFEPLTVTSEWNGTQIVHTQRALGVTDAVTLDPLTCHIVAVDGTRDNPNGVPRLGGFLIPALGALCDQYNLDGSLDANAWPTIWIEMGVPAMLESLASPDAQALCYREEIQVSEDGEQHVVRINETPGDTVRRWVEEYKEAIEATFNSSSRLYVPSGKVDRIAAADLTGIQFPIENRIREMCHGLLTPRTVLSYSDGGTQAYSQTELRRWQEELTEYRDLTNGVLLIAAQTHLRSLGSDATVVAIVEPLTEINRLLEAQADTAVYAYVMGLLADGWIDEDEAGTRIGVGEAAEPEVLAAALERRRSGVDDSGGTPADTSQNGDAGGNSQDDPNKETQDEND